MKTLLSVSTLGVVALLASASASFAGSVIPAPAPLLGAGLPGLAVLAVAGAGYLGLRMRRGKRD
jgi:hypothetical protein